MNRIKKLLAVLMAVVTLMAVPVVGNNDFGFESLAACCSCSDCDCPKNAASVCHCDDDETDTTSAWIEAKARNKTDNHKHSYTSKTTKKATCFEEGIKTYICSCGASYTKSIKKLSHIYSTKLVKATMSANGKHIYTCKVCGYVKTTPIARIKTVYLTNSKFEFDDNVKTPGVVVKDSNGKALRSGSDYSVSYSEGRTKIGEYSVYITFKGNYSGSCTLKFKIVLGTVKTITQDKNYSGVAFDWSSVYGADGYILYHYDGLSKKYIKSGTKTLTSVIYSYVDGSMGVKIRAYKDIDGKRVYSDFSEAVRFYAN